jgi:hypothetical protein
MKTEKKIRRRWDLQELQLMTYSERKKSENKKKKKKKNVRRWEGMTVVVRGVGERVTDAGGDAGERRCRQTKAVFVVQVVIVVIVTSKGRASWWVIAGKGRARHRGRPRLYKQV